MGDAHRGGSPEYCMCEAGVQALRTGGRGRGDPAAEADRRSGSWHHGSRPGDCSTMTVVIRPIFPTPKGLTQ